MIKVEKKNDIVYLRAPTKYFWWPAKFRGGWWDRQKRCFCFPAEKEAEVRDLVARFVPVDAALRTHKRALERFQDAKRESQALKERIFSLCENREKYGNEYGKLYCKAWLDYEASKVPLAEARAELMGEYERLNALLNDFISTPQPT